jgi:serine protease Do
VIGINSMIFSRTGGYMGLSFAIPVDLAMNTVAQLKEKGRVTRGRIGVQITEVSRETAESFGPRETDGSARQLGGERRARGESRRRGRRHRAQGGWPRGADVVGAAADRHDDQARQQGHADDLAQGRPKGRRRDGGRNQGRCARNTVASQRAGAEGEGEAQPLGLVLSDLTDEQRKELDGKTGVLIEDTTGSVRGNVQPGDIILAIVSRGQTTDAKNAEQVNSMLSKMDKGASVTFRLRRGEQEFFSTLKINNGGVSEAVERSEPRPEARVAERPTSGRQTDAAHRADCAEAAMSSTDASP